MRGPASSIECNPSGEENTLIRKNRSRLSFLPLVAVIFYEVSGGPFGVEDTVKAG
eukprot:c13327_g1_i1 orf=177-341(+)